MADRMITPDFAPVMQDSSGYGRTLNPDIPPGYPGTMRDLSPDILGTLGRIENLLAATYNDAVRPRTILLEPGTIFTTHVRFKLHTLVHSGGAGDRFDLYLGTDRAMPFYNVSGNPVYIPVSMFVDRGVDIKIVDTTNAGAMAWAGALLASEAD
jgi:hypothetical protein